ncbi:MAG: acetyl-CoA carboxylase biotin carboxyl carrier protein subunit [Saprospiraceae bacterium]|nr:acetyl-CoA carboxylase biotin carboxyl carrier protein subunit [Saprospiraceae bacterium]
MYKSIVNNQYQSEIIPSEINWDLIEIKEGRFHLLLDNHSYEAVVLEANYIEKTFKIKIQQNTYQVKLKNKFDLLAEQLGFSNMNVRKVNNVKAPMPGLVLDIIVKVGDQVSEGDSVLILEAMKMENIIKAERDAIVKSISIEKGSSVDKNQVLLEYE